MVDKITFEHFFIEVKGSIKKEHLILLNPNIMQFYKVQNVYVALSINEKSLVVNFALNTGKEKGGDWMKDLQEEALRNGLEKVVWHTSSENKVVQGIAKRLGLKQIDLVKNYYADGTDAIVYEQELKKLALG